VEYLSFGIVGYGRMGKIVDRTLDEEGGHVAQIIDPHTGKPWKRNSLEKVDSAICFTSPDAGYETTKRIKSRNARRILKNSTTKWK